METSSYADTNTLGRQKYFGVYFLWDTQALVKVAYHIACEV